MAGPGTRSANARPSNVTGLGEGRRRRGDGWDSNRADRFYRDAPSCTVRIEAHPESPGLGSLLDDRDGNAVRSHYQSGTVGVNKPANLGKRRKRSIARKWQTVIAATIGGVAAILAAVLPIVLSGSSTSGSPTPTPSISGSHTPTSPASASPTPGPASPGPASSPTIAISTMSRDGSRYSFVGTSTGLDPKTMLVFVMAQSPTLTVDGGRWLVSPAATVQANGSWAVTWNVPRLPVRVKWVAVIYQNSQGNCAPEATCAPPPGSGASGPGPAQASAALSIEGPQVGLAQATFTAAPSPTR